MTAWLVRKGSVVIQHEGKTITTKAGQWLIPQPGVIDRDFSDHADIISVHFQASWADRRNIFDDGLPVILESRQYPKLQRKAAMLARLVEKHFDHPEINLPLVRTTLPIYIQLQSLFESWLYSFIESLTASGLVHTRFGRVDERVQHGLFLIDHAALDQRFSKQHIAHNLSLSPSQMDRLFIKEAGCTPNAYFENRRFDFARRSLAESDILIKKVAFGLGFQSASHFSTWFRRMEGKSPREFMQTAQKNNVIFRSS